jgi:hypothetical protein
MEEKVVKRMHALWIGFLSWMVVAAAAQEPPRELRYWLEQGEGYPVCRDFLANLNAFSPKEALRMCEEKLHPTHPEFTWAAWEEMDIEANLALVHQAEGLLFAPLRAVPIPFEEWEPLFRERVRSGEANPRLRRSPLTMGDREPETFIWYEPVRDQCELDLKRTGLAGDPGGRIFVLRAGTGKLEDIIAGTGPMDVLFYYGRYPYLTRSHPEVVVVDGAQRKVQLFSIGPLLPPNDPPPHGGTYDTRYAVDLYRCQAVTDRDPR